MFDWGYGIGDWFWGWFGLSWGDLEESQKEWTAHAGGGGAW